MRRILFLFLLGLNFCNIYSQTEWKFVGGIDLTPVSTSSRQSLTSSNRSISRDKSIQNMGYLGLDVCFGGEKVRLEAAIGSAFYKDTYQAQLESFVPNGNGGYVIVKDSILVFKESEAFLPIFRASLNFSVGKKSSLKLLAFNQGKSTLNAGLAFERGIGEKLAVSTILYSAVSSLEPFYVPKSTIGGGIQVSYVFARKEKVKKEKIKKGKSSSSPTVL